MVAKATDGGGRSCQADIRLTVQDANDNAPRFSSSHYEVTVFDNTTVRTPVAVVYATDPDTGGLCGRVLRGRRGHCNVSSQVRTRRLNKSTVPATPNSPKAEHTHRRAFTCVQCINSKHNESVSQQALLS